MKKKIHQNEMIPYLTSGTVIELSAILVAKIILRVRGATLLKAIFLCCESDDECSIMVTIFVRRSFL